MPSIAVAGVGAMGGRLAARLAGAGLDVTAWNRTPARAEALAGHGVRAAPGLGDAVAGADVVLLCLTDDAAVREVVTGLGGVVEHARPGTLVIDTSTTLPRTAQEVGAACAAAGLRFVDAPISGGVEAAEAGRLTFLCGGEAGAVAAAKEVLGHLGPNVAHLGAAGAGQMAKLVSQVLMAGTLLGAAEGLGLAVAGGVDADALIEALKPGAAGSWVLEHRAPLMVSGRYPRAGAMALHLKDLENVLALAGELGVSLPGTALVRDIEQRLVAAGHGGDNVAAIGRAYLPGG